MTNRVHIVGILNVTPDSFSDGGRHATAEESTAHAEAMIEQGADWIDVGGESTRPGSQAVPAGEQIRRTQKVIEAIAKRHPTITLSIDTTQAAVAAAALDAGATVVNDTSAGLDDSELLPLVARRGAKVVLMHRRAAPAVMQVNPIYSNVTAEVREFLLGRAEFAATLGVKRADIWLDPGIGFGKTVEHNLRLLADLTVFVMTGYPVLLGTSRKKFIGTLTGESDAADRSFGTAATVAWAVAAGVAAVRVHDVLEMKRVCAMIEAIQSARTPGDASV